MPPLIPNPFANLTINQYGAELRRGTLSAENTTRAFLDRIARLDPGLGAYIHVDASRALEAARAVDCLLKTGTDLGPLMGVPVAVKDLFHVDGMPPKAGSRLDVSDVVTAEGPFVQALRRAGCVILGKTWTSEFALGGINFLQKMPWNPWDAGVQRTAGGSSGGSAVAMAAGLCAFAVGSDTGGSVRMPAALCGVLGHKLSADAFSLDGIFPLSPTLDSIGTFTACAADAVTIFTALTGAAVPEIRITGLRLAKPAGILYQDLDHEVAAAMDNALARLAAAGAEIAPMEIPELAEVEPVFGQIVPVELIALLGPERIQRGLDQLDPVSRSRFVPVLDLSATDYISARIRQTDLRRRVSEYLGKCDAWITPTTPGLPAPLADVPDATAAGSWNRRALRNTRPGNLFGQCAISLPLSGTTLPVGLQISCAPSQDARLLGIARALESALGDTRLPDVRDFAR
ncbi:MAG TPA: amidase [Burkholderiales bacterium]|nr:amidase [Burkholderiales bacterium]